MDIATIIGIVLGLGFIFLGIFLGGSFMLYVDIPSVIIVAGGSIATVFIKFPMDRVFGAIKVYLKAIKPGLPNKPEDQIREIIELAQKARKESLLALENVEIADPFLKKGIQLAVDGTEPELVKAILETEQANVDARHAEGAEIFMGIGDSAPAFGMIGTLIGLVGMLANMSDPSAIGPQMAVALLTTMYGAIIANILCIPVANKLELYNREEMILMDITIEGINAILNGDHPAIAEQKLNGYLAPSKRPQEEN